MESYQAAVCVFVRVCVRTRVLDEFLWSASRQGHSMTNSGSADSTHTGEQVTYGMFVRTHDWISSKTLQGVTSETCGLSGDKDRVRGRNSVGYQEKSWYSCWTSYCQ